MRTSDEASLQKRQHRPSYLGQFQAHIRGLHIRGYKKVGKLGFPALVLQ